VSICPHVVPAHAGTHVPGSRGCLAPHGYRSAAARLVYRRLRRDRRRKPIASPRTPAYPGVTVCAHVVRTYVVVSICPHVVPAHAGTHVPGSRGCLVPHGYRSATTRLLYRRLRRDRRRKPIASPWTPAYAGVTVCAHVVRTYVVVSMCPHVVPAHAGTHVPGPRGCLVPHGYRSATTRLLYRRFRRDRRRKAIASPRTPAYPGVTVCAHVVRTYVVVSICPHVVPAHAGTHVPGPRGCLMLRQVSRSHPRRSRRACRRRSRLSPAR